MTAWCHFLHYKKIPQKLAVYDSTYFLPTGMKWAVINFSNFKHCEKWLSMNGYYRLGSMLDYLLIKLPLHETFFPSWKGSSVLHEHTSTSHHHNFSALGCTRTLRHEPEFSWQSPTIQLHALRPHSTHYGANPACTSSFQPCKPLTTSFMPIREQGITFFMLPLRQNFIPSISTN